MKASKTLQETPGQRFFANASPKIRFLASLLTPEELEECARIAKEEGGLHARKVAMLALLENLPDHDFNDPDRALFYGVSEKKYREDYKARDPRNLRK